MKLISYMMFALLFSLSGCSSQKKLVKNPPFEMGDATCQRWVGGRAESGSGLLLNIPVDNAVATNTPLQQAFFRGRVADIKVEEKDGEWMAIANFINQREEKPDMVMHADPKKEVGNRPPKLEEKFPFELGPDECVVSYMEDGKTKYFKITGIKEKKPLTYQ
ncbi:hypothetical protein [Flagellimonas lutaonensis]|uniref:Lipoprotein n=1 Tax=Flagellimonas lutaonensis TaxID=516051 RepID=A0A0D5YT59_9FLAO|nr:hypothetical protein [Allomuricauda lutaonensis]AKA35031.1 hypothetical protein VC82_1407 [Allomuricauda lutaonensis]